MAAMCGRQGIQQFVVEQFFPRQGAFRGGQELVLEGLQFRRQVAFDVLQGLAAVIVGRHLVALGATDLDVEAADPVVFHAQVGDAGALPLAGFHGHEEAAAVGLQGAQLVQLGVEAVGDDAAFAQHRRRLGLDGARQSSPGSAGKSRRLASTLRASPASASTPAHAGRRPRLSRRPERSRGRGRRATRAAMRSRSAMPLQQTRAPCAHLGRVDQGAGWRPGAGPARFSVAQGMMQPVLQQAAAHAGEAVSSSENRVGAASPRRVSLISRCGGRRRPAARTRCPVPGQAGDMGQRGLLGMAGIVEQHAGRRLEGGLIFDAEGGQVARPKCSHNRRLPRSASNCQSGRRVKAVFRLFRSGWTKPSGRGFPKAPAVPISAAEAVAGHLVLAAKRPLDRVSQARARVSLPFPRPGPGPACWRRACRPAGLRR
jgi:hypothetical protein